MKPAAAGPSRESVQELVDLGGVSQAAGVSPSQAAPATILAVDRYGTALVSVRC